MMQLVEIKAAGRALRLLVPEAGMPQWLETAGDANAPTPALAALEALVSRGDNARERDIIVPEATLLPTGGMGSFQWPGLAGHRDGRHFVLHFEDWRIERESSDAACLKAREPRASLALTLHLALHDDGVVVLSSRLENQGTDDFQLDRMMAGSYPVSGLDHLMAFEGFWAREFHEVQESLGAGTWLRESRRGRTSHDRHPALICGTPGLPSGEGRVVGAHLGFSGNHLMAVDRLADGMRLIQAGELFEPGEMRLAPGEAYTSPKLYICEAPDMATMRAGFHAHVREHVLSWPGGAMKPRPVLLNTWEGNYFNHDLASLKAQAEAAAKLGIERFVLDDGWFPARDHERAGLGDWVVDPRKYPNGLEELADHVINLGMEFGLWFEPEMVNPDSALYRAHPEWALRLEGLKLLQSRHQLVLDLTRPEVSEALFQMMHEVLARVKVAFIKWDMNRDLTHVGDARGHAATARQTRAVYALMARLRAAHPDIEIETCASGGGRADYGALAHTHRVWTSDNTDALERQTIQAGLGLFLPPEIMGQHISALPNHQTGRRHALAFRAITAITGHFGIELNPLALTDVERIELAAWIALHKRLRPLLHGASTHFRLADHDGRSVYGVVSADKAQAIVIVAQRTVQVLEHSGPVKVPHLLAHAEYTLHLPGPQTGATWFRHGPPTRALFDGSSLYAGHSLGQIGFRLPIMLPESAVLIEIRRDTNEEKHHG